MVDLLSIIYYRMLLTLNSRFIYTIAILFLISIIGFFVVMTHKSNEISLFSESFQKQRFRLMETSYRASRPSSSTQANPFDNGPFVFNITNRTADFAVSGGSIRTVMNFKNLKDL